MQATPCIGYRLSAIGYVCVVLLVGLLGAPARVAAQADSQSPTALQAFFDELLPAQLEQAQIPGAALAVVKDGAVQFVQGYGYADLESRRPVDPAQTLFRTGSTAKPVPWTALMHLVEQGRIDLRADVNTYLDFNIPATFAEPITPAHLLSHTAGFEDVGEGLFVLTPEATMPLRDYLIARQPARVFPPGAVQAYSNYGTALAAYLVERVSGIPFNRYVEEQIFAPLGMERSTLDQPPPAQLAADLAGGYAPHNGDFLRGDFVFVGPYPAGSMSTTVADMAQFMLAHLPGSPQSILQPATVQQMQTQLYSADPRIDGIAHGWMERTSNDRRVLYHRGAIVHFSAGMYLLPEERLGLYVAYNAPGGAAATDELWNAFMDRFYPATPAPIPTPPADAAAQIDRYAGEYHLARAEFSGGGKVLRLLEAAYVSAGAEGELQLMVEGVTERYIPVAPGLFRHSERTAYLAFFSGPDGRTWFSLDGNPAFVGLTGTAAFRAPWYATTPVTALVLLGTLALSILTSFGWLIGAWRRKQVQPLPARLARWNAVAFGLGLIGFLVAFVGALTDSEPANIMPRVFFGPTPLLQVMLALPWLLATLGVGMAVFTGMAWRGAGAAGRPYWTLAGRLHYTGLTLLALAVLAVLGYWNLLAFPG
jgi:CubicO group peptidase (beta-lactamase class C family)